jgi:hypothetical protein
MLQAVGIFAVAAIFWPARRLHICRTPGFWAERTQKGRGVRGAGADFHVVWLQQGASLRVPVLLERQNNLLKCEHLGLNFAACESANERSPKTPDFNRF